MSGGVQIIGLDEVIAKRNGSVDPAKFPGEIFELLSIPAFDSGQPEIVAGAEIGSTKQVVQEGDVLLSKIVPHIRRAWIVKPTTNHRLIASGEWIVFRDSRFDPAYLRHLLIADGFHRQFMQTVSGVGGSLLRARPAEVAKIKVSLLPINEQRRIASILDKADSLRHKRQESIRLADEFLRSAFYEIFGDPVANNKNWGEREVAEIGKVTTGNTPSRDVDAYFGDALEWIKSDNINTAGHWLTKAREGLSELGATVARTAPSGSTLMTCIAGSPSCIGNVAMTNRTVAFNQQINAVTPLAGIEPEFVYALLLFSKGRIQAASTNSMKGMVSKGTLEKVRLIWPPVDLQKKFVQVFKQVQRLQSRMEAADASSLFNALQSKILP